MRLKVKLPLMLLPLVALPILVLGIVAYVQLRDVSEKRSFSQVDTMLDQFGLQFDGLVATARANLHLFSEYQLIRQYFLADTEDERYLILYRPVQRQLISIQNAYPEYYELRIILPSGYEDMRIVNGDIPNRSETVDQLVQLMGQTNDGEDISMFIMVNPDNNELACYVFKRISLINQSVDDPQVSPRFRGFLGITIDLSPFTGQLDRIRLGQKGGILLANGNAESLYLPRHLSWIKSEWPAAWGNANSESEQPTGLRLADDNYRIKSRELQPNLWLHAMIPEQELLAASRKLTVIISLITSLAILVSLTLIFLFMNAQVLKPITRLREGILKLSQGNELVHIPIERADELGELSREFNRMGFELKKSNDQIRSMAYNDYLTELPNRFRFQHILKQSMHLAVREGRHLGLLFIDLDNFKQINDTLGHQMGDRLLKDVALRLQDNLRGLDMSGRLDLGELEHNLARLGGDEFTVLLHGVKSVIEIGKVAQRLINAIEQTFVIDDMEHHISASIGIAVFPDDGDTSDDLIKHADLAMYQAKKRGKGCFEFYSNEISNLVVERSNLERRLRLAIESANFELCFQPIVNCQTLEIASLEALIRWTDDELGAVSPDRFIPVAEEMGLIHAIGDWVLSEACRNMADWNKVADRSFPVSINVSGKQLEKTTFPEDVLRNLKTFKLSPDMLVLEVTESAFIQGQVEVLETLRQLKDSGIKIALDDFGTGYSSLSYLRNLPIDVLKIDRSFIQGLGLKNNNIILSAIITMAHALDLEVIAEGVESHEQLAFLKKESCNLLQGFLYYRPESSARIIELIQSG